MKATVLGSCIALMWCVAAPVAQEQPAAGPPAHNVYMATGCLSVEGDETPAFTLTKASWIGRAAPTRAAEAGAVGTSGQKAVFQLQPASGVNAQGMTADALKAHAGQRVEVTVRPIESMPAPPPVNGATAEVQPTRPNDAPPERFTVTALNRVTGSCS